MTYLPIFESSLILSMILSISSRHFARFFWALIAIVSNITEDLWDMLCYPKEELTLIGMTSLILLLLKGGEDI